MPYIPKERRTELDRCIKTTGEVDTSGELNYILTKIILNYIRHNGISYNTYNEVIGILECTKQELYARLVRPYEDEKKELNGDVYG